MNKPNLFAMIYPVNVLVSDNNPCHREETVKLLIEMGYHPDEAASDEALLSSAGNGRYDVILLNVRITENADTERKSETAQQSRPLLIGISQTAKLHFANGPGCLASDILFFRPTTKEELMVQLKSCSMLAGKYISDSSR